MKAWAIVGAMAMGGAATVACGASGADDTESGNGALSAATTTNPVACAGTTATKPVTLSCKMVEGPADSSEEFPLTEGPDPGNLVASGRQHRSVVIASLQSGKTDYSTFSLTLEDTHSGDSQAFMVGSASVLSQLNGKPVFTIAADEDGLNAESVYCTVK